MLINNSLIFQWGKFQSASGQVLDWKIECNKFTDYDWECLARMIAINLNWHENSPNITSVEGVPSGGLKLASYFRQHLVSSYWHKTNRSGPEFTLIVDDVFTTGGSLEEYRNNRANCIGYVVFQRSGVLPRWCQTLFTMPTPLNVIVSSSSGGALCQIR
jgi:hypothetical protein